MSTYLSSCLRAGVRVVGAGALAAGLMTAAPAPTATAASANPAVAPAAADQRTQAQRTKTQRAKAQRTKAQRRAAARQTHRRQVARKISNAVNTARRQKGDRYQYGASGPNAFDCSGLMYYSFRRAGFRGIPRTSSAQAGFAKRIARKSMRKGDMVFFTGSGGVYHVGVFTGWERGRRMIVHAPYGNQRVQRAPIWTNSWFPGTLRFK
ncbi:C40 family peptidase [Nocardioides pantholopis]|uniref:C40 family peptidase n=1 Tax=Nocardioides pantholopis TaxID=2483798 RepID=UPI000FDCB753|nr:C40 family peptidase [Nocardioides pantholopis]